MLTDDFVTATILATLIALGMFVVIRLLSAFNKK